MNSGPSTSYGQPSGACGGCARISSVLSCTAHAFPEWLAVLSQDDLLSRPTPPQVLHWTGDGHSQSLRNVLLQLECNTDLTVPSV